MKFGDDIIIVRCHIAYRESNFPRTFDKQDIRILVPVVWVDSEPFGAFDKCEWTLGVEGAVQTGARRACRYPDDQRILKRVALGWEVAVIVRLG